MSETETESDRLSLIEQRLDLLADDVRELSVMVRHIVGQVDGFKANIDPALKAIQSGGIMSMLMGRKH